MPHSDTVATQRAMLEKLEGQGHMFATDVDPIESEKTKSVSRKQVLERIFSP